MGKFISKIHWGVILIFLVVTFFLTLPLFLSLKNLGGNDWDQHYAYAQSAIYSLQLFGQLPLWNPYHCGGLTGIGNPQTDFFSPFFPVLLLFQPVIGYKILFGLFIFIGLCGAYLFGRSYKISTKGSLFVACSYAVSGLFTSSFASGMTQFMYLALLPVVVLLINKAFSKKPLMAIYIGILLTVIFFGGVHFIPLVFLFLFIYAIVYLVKLKSLQPLIVTGFVLIVFASLSSVKLLPGLIQIKDRQPAAIETDSGYSIKSLLYSLLSHNQTFAGYAKWGVPKTYDFDENGLYVGIIILAFFCLGLWKKGKKEWILTLIFFLFLWFSFGYNITPSIYSLLRKLPIFNYLRVAQRYRYVFMIPFSLFVGYGFDHIYILCISQKKNKKLWLAFLFFVVTCGMADMILVNSQTLKTSFPIALADYKFSDTFTQSCQGYLSEYPRVLMNKGTLDCYEPLKVSSGNTRCLKDGNYKGEYYLDKKGGYVSLKQWTTDKLIFRTKVNDVGRLVINQNYSDGWYVKVESATGWKERRSDPYRGLISTTVNPGDTKITFYFLPASFVIGALFSLVGLIAVLFILVLNR